MKLLPRAPVVLADGTQHDAARLPDGGFQRRFTPLQTYETEGDSKHEFAWSRLQYTPLGGSFGGFGAYDRRYLRILVARLSQSGHHVSRRAPAAHPD